MKRWNRGFSAVAACLALALVASSALALAIAPPPGPARIASSDAVIVGKVVGIEPQDVKVDTVTYRIAVVQVEEAIRGAKDSKSVRIGFVPAPTGPAKGPIIRPGARGVQLQVGNEGIFLLTKRAKENFYFFGGPFGYFLSSETKGFPKEVAAVKGIARVATDPEAALKSKDAEDRLIAAAVLIERYRTYRGSGKPRAEPVDTGLSKQILLALADADWNTAHDAGMFRPNPVNLFYRLGVTQADGWSPPKGDNPAPSMQSWLRDHAEKFRIQRFVSDDNK
jgi:hypothetical protein